MKRNDILPVLYDLVSTIGNQVSLKPLLIALLQRLLYHTSYSAGFVCLNVPACDHSEGELFVTLEAVVGDFELIGMVGRQVSLPRELFCCVAEQADDQADLLAAMPYVHTRYRAFLSLPFGGGFIVLLSEIRPETSLPLKSMLQPVLAHLSKAIVLCRSNDTYTTQLLSQRDMLSEVFESSYSSVMITDPNARILKVNPAFSRITGFTAEEVIGLTPHVISAGKHDAAFYKDMWDSLLSSGHWEGEIWNRRKNGEMFPGWLIISAVRNKAGELLHYVGMFSDITERKAAEVQIHQLAFYDALTHLPNRRLLMDRLQQALSASGRSGRYGAVLFLDLDNFKQLNDSKGHVVGDQLLVEVANRLNGAVRDGDTVARLGGDEFVVIMESLSEDEAEAVTKADLVAEKILAKLAQPYWLSSCQHHSTPSMGVVLFRGHEHAVEDILKFADTAMYQAKSAGRNGIRFYDPEMQAAIEMRAELESELRLGISKNQFHLHYQLQVEREDRPIGAEVLVRWLHPRRGNISPTEFIPLAEDTGLIAQIGQWVLQGACAQLKKWEQQPEFRDLALAVNVSPKQFRQADFVAQVAGVLKASGANPRLLKLELTESTVLDNVEDAALKMHNLKEMGVSFAMDDFGTGYSSLQYLKRLPLSQIKIDQSFVRDIANDENDAAIVQAISAMGMALELEVIAEGVETSAQRDFLKLCGCHAFQGYLYARPLPVDEFEALLRSR